MRAHYDGWRTIEFKLAHRVLSNHARKNHIDLAEIRRAVRSDDRVVPKRNSVLVSVRGDRVATEAVSARLSAAFPGLARQGSESIYSDLHATARLEGPPNHANGQ